MTARKKIKYYIIDNLILPWLYFLVRCYLKSLKLEIPNLDYLEKLLENRAKKPVILSTYHQMIFVPLELLKYFSPRFRVPMIISPSKDGDIVADLIRRSGGNPIRGSSSRKGASALLTMLDELTGIGFGFHVVDGPKGPMGVVKGGLVQMAQSSGGVVVPLYIKAKKAWHFNSWDKFFLPKPFSRVTMSFGTALEVNQTQDKEEFEAERKRVENHMNSGLN